MSKKRSETTEPKWSIGQVFSEDIAKLSLTNRKKNMERMAYNFHKDFYMRPLDESDLAQRRRTLGETMIAIQELEIELKNLKDEIKAKLTGPEETRDKMIAAIKNKVERRDGMLYYIDDQDNGKMFTFDEDAVCVDVRDLTKSEQQTKIKGLIAHTGTDGE